MPKMMYILFIFSSITTTLLSHYLLYYVYLSIYFIYWIKCYFNPFFYFIIFNIYYDYFIHLFDYRTFEFDLPKTDDKPYARIGHTFYFADHMYTYFVARGQRPAFPDKE